MIAAMMIAFFIELILHVFSQEFVPNESFYIRLNHYIPLFAIFGKEIPGF